MPRPTYYTVPTLKERDWTEALIKRFLHEHDETQPNPNYRSAAPMKLYLQSRVQAVEASNDFQQALIKSNKRRDAGKAGSETKRQKAVAEVTASFRLRLPKGLTEADLIQRACDYYNQYHQELIQARELERIDPDSPRYRVIQAVVTFVRHRRSNYDALLDALAGVTGKAEARLHMKDLVVAQLEELGYTQLAQEYRKNQERD